MLNFLKIIIIYFIIFMHVCVCIWLILTFYIEIFSGSEFCGIKIIQLDSRAVFRSTLA